MKDGGSNQTNAHHSRKGFDSFTPQHKLRDAKEEYLHAVYRFREAEQTNSPDLIALKRVNDRWHAFLDEARKKLDACTTHEKLGVLHRLSFQFDQIYGLYATRLYDQGFGKN